MSRQHPRAACVPAHKLLATGGFDDTVFLFDLATGKRLRSISIDDQSAGPMALAPDGKTLVVECRADLCVFDVATGKEKARLTGHGSRIDGLAFSADGKWLASCGGKEDIRVWETATGKLHRLIKNPDNYVRFLAFAPDNRTLGVVAETEKEDIVRSWDAVTGVPGTPILPRMRAGSLAFSPDGKSLAVAGDNLRVLDRVTGKELWTAEFADQENHQRRLCRVAFSPDGKQVATASGLTIYLFDAHTGRNGRLIKARSKPVKTDSSGANFITLLAFAGDGKTLYSWACGDRVRAWDLQTGRDRLAVDGHQGAVVSVAFSADGKRVISTAEDDHLRLWEAGTGKEIALSQPALASDGYQLVLPGDEKKPPVLVDAMGKVRLRLEKEVQHWVLSPDGKFLIGWNGNPANEFKVWRADGDWQSGQVVVAGITAYRPPGPAAFSLKPPLLALVEDPGRVQIRRLTGTLVHVRTLDAGQGHRCIHAAMSPDGPAGGRDCWQRYHCRLGDGYGQGSASLSDRTFRRPALPGFFPG